MKSTKTKLPMENTKKWIRVLKSPALAEDVNKKRDFFYESRELSEKIEKNNYGAYTCKG